LRVGCASAHRGFAEAPDGALQRTLQRSLPCTVAIALAFASGVASASSSSTVGQRSCGALSARVDAAANADALFLRSYDDTREAPLEPALATAAFTYDNALATIALIACDRRSQALRIGEALRRAAAAGQRVRNVYRAGAVADTPLPNGWWDAAANRWVEDAYQDGTATGNVAWAALALLALHDATGDDKWLDAARRLARWVMANTADARGTGGFSGGVQGFDAAPQKLVWKSTEHNIDLVAVFDRLAGSTPAEWQEPARSARRFVESQWDATQGRFLVGTLPDGFTPNRETSALDVQMWPLLLHDVPKNWRRALGYAEREHGVPGGFDFNADRDGLWLEGTAQAALAYWSVGQTRERERLLTTIAAQFAPGGFVYATREPRITTGLAIGNDSSSADFYYYRRPHLGATAWAALAARNWNPFVRGGH
jgi:hypothetical protein